MAIKIQSEAILLRYYHDLKIREISDITGANEKTVKGRLRQGLDELKKLIRRDDDVLRPYVIQPEKCIHFPTEP